MNNMVQTLPMPSLHFSFMVALELDVSPDTLNSSTHPNIASSFWINEGRVDRHPEAKFEIIPFVTWLTIVKPCATHLASNNGESSSEDHGDQPWLWHMLKNTQLEY
jgi:hypothetical protein